MPEGFQKTAANLLLIHAAKMFTLPYFRFFNVAILQRHLCYAGELVPQHFNQF